MTCGIINEKVGNFFDMSRRKLNWIKTIIPERTKIKLWQLMIGNTTHPSWLAAIEAEVDKYQEWKDGPSRKDMKNYSVFDKFDIKFISSSRETYNSLYEELEQMPFEYVIRLPSNLQTWIMQLRPELESEKYPRREAEDYSAITNVDTIVLMPGLERRHKTWVLYKWVGLDEEEIVEKLGISSESFWRDIEETEKEGVGKVKAKELTKALNVSWLMGRFLSCLRAPDPRQIYPVGTEQIELYETSWVEEHPLFPELKRLLNNKFWEKFNDWKKARVKCFKECVSFLDTVRQKAEEESQLKTTECWEKEGLDDTFWQRIYTHVLLKTKPQPLNELDRDYLKRLDTTEFVTKDNDLIVKGENYVLAKGEPFQLDRVSKAYWSLIASFTSASEPKQIWALWQELDKTEKLLNVQAEAVYREIVPNWFRYREIEI